MVDGRPRNVARPSPLQVGTMPEMVRCPYSRPRLSMKDDLKDYRSADELLAFAFSQAAKMPEEGQTPEESGSGRSRWGLYVD
jgi:hypothetical protein